MSTEERDPDATDEQGRPRIFTEVDEDTGETRASVWVAAIGDWLEVEDAEYETALFLLGSAYAIRFGGQTEDA
jgi:hypothetical protein